MQKYTVIAGILMCSCLLAVTLAQTNEPTSPRFEPATVESSAEPVYPLMAMGAGTVVFEVSVDAEGDVQDVKFIKKSKAFDSPALEAIKKWKFKPALLDGKPVPSVVPVAFSFGWPAACAQLQ